MNPKKENNKIISLILVITLIFSYLPKLPVVAEELSECYSYTIFASSESIGAISISANNFCLNGNIATNGTIVSDGNINLNGTKKEYAQEKLPDFSKKINSLYFKSQDVEKYIDGYKYENDNILVDKPLEIEGNIELIGNINMRSGIKATGNINFSGEIKNADNVVIYSEEGDVCINTSNVSYSGLIYAPHGNITIISDNLNLNSVIIIGQTITIDSPNANINYNNNIAEILATSTDASVEEREKEPLENIGDIYHKVPTSEDIIFDETTGVQYVKNQLLISAFIGTEKSVIDEIATEVGANIVGYIEVSSDYQIEFTEDKDIEDLEIIADYINSYSFISNVTLNFYEETESAMTTTNDSLYNDNRTCTNYGTSSISDDWNESNPKGDNWGVEALKVPSAWDYKSKFQSVKVGVVDSGFSTHEDLIFDDIINNTTSTSSMVHGTHVSGIIAAQHNNSLGISGVATDVRHNH